MTGQTRFAEQLRLPRQQWSSHVRGRVEAALGDRAVRAPVRTVPAPCRPSRRSTVAITSNSNRIVVRDGPSVISQTEPGRGCCSAPCGPYENRATRGRRSATAPGRGSTVPRQRSAAVGKTVPSAMTIIDRQLGERAHLHAVGQAGRAAVAGRPQRAVRGRGRTTAPSPPRRAAQRAARWTVSTSS